MPLNPVSSPLEISYENLLFESEARRLYWAGRLRVSIDLLLMKNHQSQLDLVVPSSYTPAYPLLQHRSRSLFNILQDDRPPAEQLVAKEDGQLFDMEPKRSNRRPPQQSKVRS